MAVDPAPINQGIAAQLPQNTTGRITVAALIAALTVGGPGYIGSGITSWVSANFQPTLSTLPSCTPGSAVAPVPAGQLFQCSGIILVAK